MLPTGSTAYPYDKNLSWSADALTKMQGHTAMPMLYRQYDFELTTLKSMSSAYFEGNALQFFAWIQELGTYLNVKDRYRITVVKNHGHTSHMQWYGQGKRLMGDAINGMYTRLLRDTQAAVCIDVLRSSLLKVCDSAFKDGMHSASTFGITMYVQPLLEKNEILFELVVHPQVKVWDGPFGQHSVVLPKMAAQTKVKKEYATLDMLEFVQSSTIKSILDGYDRWLWDRKV